MTVLLYACFCVSIMKSLALFMGKGKGRILITYADRGQKNRVSGVKGGGLQINPPVFSETQGFFKKPKKPKEKEKENEKENEKEKENERENEKENENESESDFQAVMADKPPPRTRFLPPIHDRFGAWSHVCLWLHKKTSGTFMPDAICEITQPECRSRNARSNSRW